MTKKETQKNLMGKARTKENPYATFEGQGPFGDTKVHLLKVYQKPSKEFENQYARWMIAVASDMTYGSYDIGDTYVNEAVYGLHLVHASDEFKKQYWDSISDLSKRGNFSYKKEET